MLYDVQGLRAVAVLLVFAFHLWPESVPGGYVGVDVFFVISGYLVTGILLREQERTGGTDLWAFYAGRIRRLVPAAAVVIGFVAFAAPLLPSTQWAMTSQEILASALFVENWLLASRAVDYMERGEAPGILQHYWSLGVEAQFYLLWPFVVVAAARVAARFRVGVGTAVAVAAVVAVAIFLPLSAWLTYTNPARAYFATETRIWEFAIGGVIAAASLRGRLPGAAAAAMQVLGLAGIVFAAFVFSSETFFPGWVALLPVLAAALVIAAPTETPAGKLLACRPAVFIGGISYSVYLWHWPLIVLWSVVWPESYGLAAHLAIIAATVALASLSKAFVEDPLRRPRSLTFAQQSFVGGSAFVFMAAATAVIPLNLVAREKPAATAVSADLYPGAAVLSGRAVLVADPPPFMPLPSLAKDDTAVANRDACQVMPQQEGVRTCEYGDANGRPHFVVVGDSHAAQFSDALKAVAEANGWRYTHMTKALCPFAAVTVIPPSMKGLPYESCDRWNAEALARLIDMRPDYVISGQMRGYKVQGDGDDRELMRDGLLRRWQDLRAYGIDVIVLRDTPLFPMAPAKCLAEGRTDCDVPRSKALHGPEPALDAAALAGVPIIDLTDAICEADVCRAVVGNVLAWRDNNHLSATYVRTMVPGIELALRAAMTRNDNARRID